MPDQTATIAHFSTIKRETDSLIAKTEELSIKETSTKPTGNKGLDW